MTLYRFVEVLWVWFCLQVGPHYLCHWCGRSSLRQCRPERTGGCQRYPRNPEESGKFKQKRLLKKKKSAQKAGQSNVNNSFRWNKLSTSAHCGGLISWAFPAPLFFSYSEADCFLSCSLPLFLSLSPLLYFLSWWIDRFFFLGRSGVKQTCWGEWLNNQLSFLTAPNELHRSCGLEAISPLLPHLWAQLVQCFP